MEIFTENKILDEARIVRLDGINYIIGADAIISLKSHMKSDASLSLSRSSVSLSICLCL